jgi:hypothetical protein
VYIGVYRYIYIGVYRCIKVCSSTCTRVHSPKGQYVWEEASAWEELAAHEARLYRYIIYIYIYIYIYIGII